jgi:hypothetical protein
LGADDELLSLWKERSTADLDLRRELAHAMTFAPLPRVLPAIVEYMRMDWGRRVRSPEFRDAVFARGEGINGSKIESALEAPIQTGLIQALAKSVSPDTIVAFAEDVTLSPWVRLVWFWRTSIVWQTVPGLRPRIVAAVDALARESAGDEELIPAIAAARKQIESWQRYDAATAEQPSVRSWWN